MTHILDKSFRYTESAATNIAATFARFGFRVRSYDEQKAAAQERMQNVCKPRLTIKGGVK